jgi:hypothetical protein
MSAQELGELQECGLELRQELARVVQELRPWLQAVAGRGETARMRQLAGGLLAAVRADAQDRCVTDRV